ncbi:integrase, catalytic region, zinc finger, CCHC-type containing protein [Tanacetum coccineum]
MAKASPTQAWLWHRRLSHLNFDYINLLSKKDVVIVFIQNKVASINGKKYILASFPNDKKRQIMTNHRTLHTELQNVSPSADTTVPSQQELDLLFGPLYDEFFNDGTSRVNKSSSPTDKSTQ